MLKELWLPILAMVLYVIGGIATFTALGLIVFMRGKNLWGWGTGDSIGYLFLCVGLALSILGVLFMRIFRNR